MYTAAAALGTNRRALRDPPYRDRRTAAQSRGAADRLGLAVQTYLDRGELVPGQVVLGMVRQELVGDRRRVGPRRNPTEHAPSPRGYLIGRELGMTADVALHLQVNDRELMRRLLARAALERRSDDTADIAQPHARVVCDAQQDPGAVGRELQLAILEDVP
jgi:hypothetical protein